MGTALSTTADAHYAFSERRFLRHVRHAVAVLEEALHLRDLKRVSHTLIHASQSQRVSFFLMANVSSNQRSNSGRVDVRHAGEINHQCISSTGANQVLKFIERANGQWSRELEDAFLIL